VTDAIVEVKAWSIASCAMGMFTDPIGDICATLPFSPYDETAAAVITGGALIGEWRRQRCRTRRCSWRSTTSPHS